MRSTLLADGSSDRALLPILRWTLAKNGVPGSEPQFADFRALPWPPKSLVARLTMTLRQFPCDLLFVHRDAEAQSPDDRRDEIRRALDEVRVEDRPSLVCVVPV